MIVKVFRLTRHRIAAFASRLTFSLQVRPLWVQVGVWGQRLTLLPPNFFFIFTLLFTNDIFCFFFHSEPMAREGRVVICPIFDESLGDFDNSNADV